MQASVPRQHKATGLAANLLFFLQVLMVVLWLFHDQLSIPASLAWTGRMHPLLVHFPIALLLILAMAWFFRLFVGDSLFKEGGFRSLLLLSAIFATITAISGFSLSMGDDYDEDLLNRHRNLGTLTALLSYLLWIIYPREGMRVSMRNELQQDQAVPEMNIDDAAEPIISEADSADETLETNEFLSSERASRYRKSTASPIPSLMFSIVLTIAGVIMIAASHFGGSLTHGEDYLFPGNDTIRKQTKPVTDSSPVFEASILPILESKCYTCHNEKKAKGGLVMSTIDGLLKGGKNGVPWIAGDPVNSLLVQRLALDITDKKHMPPKGKPQLSESDIELIRYWIHRGADRSVAFRDLSPADSLRRLAETVAPSIRGKDESQKIYDFPAASPAAIARLQSPYRTILPIHQGSPALELSFFLKQGFKPSMIKECETVRDNVVSLNLSHMPVNDSILRMVASFSNLEILNLNGTDISDKGLEILSSLKHLTHLSLSNTKVTASGLKLLNGLPSLRKVYVWQTGVEAAQFAMLRQTNPKVQWDPGSKTDPTEKLRLTPPQLLNPDKHIFKPGEKLSLYHPMNGIQIRYTTDGSDPDSLQSAIYREPLAITGPTTVKALAVMDGWFASDAKVFSLFSAGLKPVTASLLTQPDPKYALQGGTSLFDQQKGDPGNLLINWLGFREVPMKLVVHTDGIVDIDRVIVSTAINHYSYVFPPAEVIVRAAMDSGRWSETVRVRPDQPSKYGPLQNLACTAKLPPAKWKYLEITVKPVSSLPAWHNGKGQKGWAFVDEVFID